MLAIVLALTAAQPGDASGAEAQMGPWTLADCLAYALEHAPRLEAERHRIGAAEQSTREAESASAPRVGVSGSAAAQGAVVRINIPGMPGPVTVKPPMQAGLSVQVALPIDISHRLRHTRQAARFSEAAQRDMYRQAVQQLLLEVTTGYFRVLGAQALTEAARADLVRTEGDVRLVSARQDAGAATPADVALAESARARAAEAVASTEGAAADAQANLATLIGRRADEAPELVDEPLALDWSLEWEQARDVALEERPELAALSMGARALGASADAVHASSRPSLSLGAMAGLSTPTAFSSDQEWRIGLSFSWPLSDGGATDAQESRLHESQAAALKDLEDTRLRIELQVRAAITNLSVLGERITADEAALARAETALRQVQARQAAGAARRQDVVTAEAARASALAVLKRDRCDRSVSLAEWGRALGVLDKLMTVDGDATAPEEAIR